MENTRNGLRSVEINPAIVYGLTRQELDKIRRFLVYGNAGFSIVYLIVILYAALRLSHNYLTKRIHLVDSTVLGIVLMGYFCRVLSSLTVKRAEVSSMIFAMIFHLVSFILNTGFVLRFVRAGERDQFLTVSLISPATEKVAKTSLQDDLIINLLLKVNYLFDVLIAAALFVLSSQIRKNGFLVPHPSRS